MSGLHRRYIWLSSLVTVVLLACAGWGAYLHATHPELFSSPLPAVGDFGGILTGRQVDQYSR